MAKVRRVYEIAKELNVASKSIVDKCQAEGVPGIDTHMSPVKIGLELTIKEWFGSAEAAKHSAAVETAEKVDVAKAKKARRNAPGSTARMRAMPPRTLRSRWKNCRRSTASPK